MRRVYTHYDTLKVARDAPPEVIRAAYKSLSQKYHPDRNPGDSDAARMMVIINAAYDILSDPVKRRQYDERIREAESESEDTAPPRPRASAKAPLSPMPIPRPRAQFRRAWLAYALLIPGLLSLAWVFQSADPPSVLEESSSNWPAGAPAIGVRTPAAEKVAVAKASSPARAQKQVSDLDLDSATLEAIPETPDTVSPPPAPPPVPVVAAANTPFRRQATVPAGTPVIVRTRNTLSTVQSWKGNTFSATLEQPLIVDGYVIAEKGASVEGSVERSERAGRVEGVSNLAITLVRLETSDGQRLPISTNLHEVEGGRSRSSNAKKVGAATAIGAAIGAIVGGGRGAAIGAGLGAGAGTSAVVSTRGKDVVIPSESELVFYLKAPLDFNERR